MSAIDLRYARALETVVAEKNLTRDDVKRQLQDFLSMYADSAPLREVLSDPSIPQDQKTRMLDAMAQRTAMGGTVRNFVAVVTSHERLGDLPEIVEAYLQLADKDNGVVEAQITSARALDEAARRRLEQSIATLTGETQVRATYTEDADLLGGAVVKVGSTVYDGSVRGQLQQMKQQLMTVAN